MERARRFGLTSIHPATLSCISPHQTPRLVDRLPHFWSKSFNDGRCNYAQNHQHGSYCSHLLEHVLGPNPWTTVAVTTLRTINTAATALIFLSLPCRVQGRKHCLVRGEDIEPTGAPCFLRSAMALADTRWWGSLVEPLRSPHASRPANLERVVKTWKQLASSFCVPIASEFFKNKRRNAYLRTFSWF